MALSGSFSKQPVSGSQFGLICEWNGIQNLTGVYTDVTLKVYLSYYNLTVSSRNDCTAQIGDDSETYSCPAINDSSSGWKKKLLKVKTTRIYHNAAGQAKGVKLSASWRFGANYEGTYVGTILAETTVDLDTISTNSQLNSVGTIYIDSDAPVLPITITVFNSSYEHTLTVIGKNGLLEQFSGIKGRTGPQNISLTLSSAQKVNFFAELGTNTETEIECYLTTYSSSGAVGQQSIAKGKIATSQEYSAPTFEGITYKDVSSSVPIITGDDQIIIQNKSQLQVTINGAEAKNGATIVQYRVSLGLQAATSTSNVINLGSVSVYGEKTITVSVTDSRGFTASKDFPITIISYEKDISINEWSLSRKNNVGTEVTLKFKGTYPNLFSNGITISYFTVYDIDGVPLIGEGLTPTYSNGEFAYTGILPFTFDSNKSYTIEVYVADKFSSDSENIRLNRGTPQVEFRQGYVNINDGLRVKGYGIGFVRELEDDDNLFNLTEGGVYCRSTTPPTGKNYPSQNAGVLEFFNLPIKLLRYTDITGTVKTSIFSNGQFTAWK